MDRTAELVDAAGADLRSDLHDLIASRVSDPDIADNLTLGKVNVTLDDLELLSTRHDVTVDHGAIGRLNAWFFDTFAGPLNRAGRYHKRHAFEGLTAGSVLEIGAGAGANLPYLPAGAHLYALEPNRHMQERLRRRCARAGIDLTLLPTNAEKLPLEDESVDEVICTLVLCTVADPARVVAEVRRVLRPGGRFRFVEHVAAPSRGPRRFVQRVVRRPWGWLFDGCDPHRDTIAVLEHAHFADLRIEHRKFSHSPFWPVNTAIWGIATR